ncbi:MAG: VWA domain-containing protein [Ignavibacteriaceae bacterium]|nr:VWA domain-containing protein [Ignavibacteriaceae bacterium]
MKLTKILICTLIAVISAIFFSCSRSPENSSTAVTNTSIEIKDRQHITGLDIFLLIDQSGSMIGNNGTDQNGIRYDASRYLVQSLFVKKSDDEFPNRISIIHFGDNATSSGLLEVLPGNLNKIQDAIRSGHATQGANTNIIKALQAVKSDFERAPKYVNRRERAIVIFTDGKPEKGNNESQALIQSYFKEIKDYVQTELKDFKLFIIGIDNPAANVKFSQTIIDWKEFLVPENISSIRNLDELYTKFNESVEKILELKSSQVLVKDSGEFIVNPYVDELEFHVFARHPLQLSIYDPQKRLIKIDSTLLNNAGYIIQKEKSPAPGTWTYNLKRQQGDLEPIRIVRNEIPFRLELLKPEPIFNSIGQRYFPLGKKIRLKARFTKENQQEIVELKEYPLSFSARITSSDNPGFDKQIRFLKENKAGLNYYADETFAFDKEGTYNIRLTVKGGTAVEFVNTEPIEVLKIPYFEIEEPLPLAVLNINEPIKLKGSFKIGDQSIDPGKYFIDNPSNIVLSQVVLSPDSIKSAAIWLEQSKTDKSVISGILPTGKEEFNTSKEGVYQIAFDFKTKPLIQYYLFPERIISVYDITLKEQWYLKIWNWCLRLFYIFLALVLLGGLYKIYKILIKGVSYPSYERSILAIPQLELDESDELTDQDSGPQENITKEYTIIAENSLIKNYTSPPVSVRLGKNKKGKELYAKFWARPLDKDGKRIEIYSGNFLTNLLFWKKPVAIIDATNNNKSIKIKNKSIEFVANGEIQNTDYDSSGSNDDTGQDSPSESSNNDFSF